MGPSGPGLNLFGDQGWQGHESDRVAVCGSLKLAGPTGSRVAENSSWSLFSVLEDSGQAAICQQTVSDLKIAPGYTQSTR